MIKNSMIKNVLSKTVFRGISFINKIVPKDENTVLLYSNMGFRDNISYIYDYMIYEGYNSKYRIVRSQNEQYKGHIPENVKIESNVKSVLTYLRAGHIFYCFGKLPIYPAKNQKVIQMWHGSPFKGADVRQKREMTGDYRKSYYTNALSTSEIFNEFWAEEFDCGLHRISICGQPRTDVMVDPYTKEELGISEEKIIIWMPTFRKSTVLGYNDVQNSSGILPVIELGDLKDLNRCLSDNNAFMIIKLHPMQDTGGFSGRNLSNLRIYRHDEFQDEGYDLYRLLGTSDAIITDYSSVFLDYILLNRPIGFTEDDIEDYKEGRGFAMSDPDHYRAGPKIRTMEDLTSFIEDVASGIDEWRYEREKINCEVNRYRDFNNRKRALMIGGVTI